MATWLIGDVQGHRGALDRLLDAIGWRRGGGDRLVLLGDLVNGGPDDLGALRRARELDAVVLLGNQDLRLLAVHAGLRELRKKDTFEDVLDAPDAGELADWLRRRPLVHHDEGLGILALHAGLLPPWTARRAVDLAAEAEAALRDDRLVPLLAATGENTPVAWRDDLEGIERLRVILDALTRVRVVDAAGRLDYDYKAGLDGVPEGRWPWFLHPDRPRDGTTVVFGHWSAIGLHRADRAVCLDSGVRWGGKLTAWRAEDGRVVQVDAG